MYEICYRSNGDKYSRKISVIDKDYVISILTHILDCWDLESITVIDGLTGELLYEYSNDTAKIHSSDFIKFI